MENETGVMMASLPCIFCSGKGKDPFGVMSHLSDCPVCLGKGVVQVPVPYMACAHFQGSGAIKRQTCTACRGRGRVAAP
jgi:DnaJ-class molecular chaperone